MAAHKGAFEDYICVTTIRLNHRNLLHTDSYITKSFFMVLFDHMHHPKIYYDEVGS